MKTLQKITRIAFNSNDWQRPSGDAAKTESPGTYSKKFGFGHEEWILRSEWLIDGWRYSFLQGVNNAYKPLNKSKPLLDVTLFTIQSDRRRRLIASIDSMECLDERQAAEALKEFKRRGWYDTMLEEISDVDGKPSALGDPNWAPLVLNVRFRLENVRRFPLDAFIPQEDPISKLPRYLLYDFPDRSPALDVIRGRRGTTSLPNARLISRRGAGPVEYTPEHRRIQTALQRQLRLEYPQGKDRI